MTVRVFKSVKLFGTRTLKAKHKKCVTRQARARGIFQKCTLSELGYNVSSNIFTIL